MFQYIPKTMGVKEKIELENAQRELEKVSAASEIAFVVMAESAMIDEVTATEHLDIFSPWVVGTAYQVGNLRIYGEGEARTLYKCIQAHTSQADWTPDVAVSLWTIAGDPAVEFPDWSQPVGAHDAYQTGDKVTYEGQRWVSTADNNIWVPGVYGWEVSA